jgi:hypothetical protein
MRIYLIGIVALISQFSWALAPLNCDLTNAPVAQMGSATDASKLLEKIQLMADASPLNLGLYEQFTNQVQLTTNKLGKPVTTVEIRNICDLRLEAAKADSTLKNIQGPLKQSVFTIEQFFPSFVISGEASNVLMTKVIQLKGRIITGSCDDKFNCQDIYQVYIDSVESKILRGYQTGGMSSAGGGR